jgi:HTH-type transcriptional regulator, sugar sensing transcriptional regulator
MDTSILEDIGLTNAEIKIYLALLELGQATAGPVIKRTKLQNSVVHMTLAKLVEKGLVSFIIKGKIKHYQATDPSNITEFIEDKKRRFEQILPELLLKQRSTVKQSAEVYEGFKGFKTMLYDLIKDGKKGDEFLFFSFYTHNPDDFDNVYTFYNEYEKKRKELGLKVKGIASKEIKSKFQSRDIRNILFVDFPVPLNISVFKNKVIFTPWEDERVSFLIHSRQLANSYRKYFYSIWKKYKK